MAIYHLSIQVFSRGKGDSAVMKAAYRAGENLTSDYDGREHDYTRKGGVVHTEIMLPGHAPVEYADRSILWNAVEKIEKSANSQMAREIEFSLPKELTREQSIALVRDYVKQTFVDKGMCADVCIHDKGDGNPHAHIMLTMRPINENGTWGGRQKKEYTLDANGDKIYDPKKRQYKCRSIPSTDWNDRDKAEEWRAAWQDFANAALEQSGSDERINHKSYERQGLDIIPTVHLGPAASQMERKGIRTERGDHNRQIEITNREIRRLRARIGKLADWLKEEAANTKPPTLADVLDEIFSRQGQSALTRLRNGVDIFNFLHGNNIADIADLDNKVNAMHRNLNSTSDEVKKVERRIKTLKEHISQSGYYKEHRSLRRQYDKLYAAYEETKKATGVFAERKAQKALEAANEFYEVNRTGLTLFDTAEKYLRGVLQERFDPKKLPPISAWEKQLAGKLAEKDALYQQYYKLKDDTYKIEKIRASVKAILHNDAPEQTPSRTRGMEIG